MVIIVDQAAGLQNRYVEIVMDVKLDEYDVTI